MVPKWETQHHRVVGMAEVTVSGHRDPKGWVTSPEELVHVPLSLRVCVQCGAAQPFANPAQVQALAELPEPAAFYVDASTPTGGYR